ncbi:hypothetical protein LTR85_009520 [Meristemomyces frigidus]|nr:hypothetical protein LTR85_009520 [Meristemomyces frigidus]
MAGRTVSATYELLESILLQLPFKDILRAKSVSKQWNAVIERSLPLKKALFLVCDPNHRVRLPDIEPNGVIFNSAGTLKDPAQEMVPLFTNVGPHGWYSNNKPWTFCRTTVPEWYGAGAEYFLRWPSRWAEQADSIPAALQGMHLARPSPTALYLMATYKDKESKRHVPVVVRDVSGITLGLIGNTFVKLLKDLPAGAIVEEESLRLKIRVASRPDDGE